MPVSSRTTNYRPALAWFAALGSAWVFVLVTLGAFTTSIGAGMAFADWPLSDGSVNPDGWLTDIAKFAEHSHRLSGTTMGLVTIGLAFWLWRTDARRWLRNLGWWALGIVIIQGIIGGQRVKLDALEVPGFDMTFGQMLRIPHGILAQIFVCVLFAIAASLSRSWLTTTSSATSPQIPCRLRALASFTTLAVLLQLIIAATMRHNSAGLAIPTFPLTPEGSLLPATWNLGVTLNFLHRLMALILTGLLSWLALATWRDAATSRRQKQLAAVIVSLLGAQITLGAFVIWTARNPYTTTAHVIVGACVLASTFLLTWLLHRDVIESRHPATPAH